MSDAHPEKVSPFTCVMDAIEPRRRPSHLATAKYLFHSVRETRELPNGYGFLLSHEPDILLKLAEFISLEKLCCPFFGFTLRVEPEGGSVWLELTGREGVKPFIQAEVGELMGDSVTFQGIDIVDSPQGRY